MLLFAETFVPVFTTNDPSLKTSNTSNSNPNFPEGKEIVAKTKSPGEFKSIFFGAGNNNSSVSIVNAFEELP